MIHTLDEEESIAACLESVAWADEVLVVDMESEDRTAEIAREHGARVVSHPRTGFADPARQFGIDQARSEWVLVVDADERVPPALVAEVRRLVELPDVDLVEIPRKNLFLGRWVRHGGEWPNGQRRLLRREAVGWPGQVHTQPEPIDRMVTLPAREELALVHYWVESIDDFLARIGRYTPLEVELAAQSPHPFRRRHVVIHPLRELWSRLVREQGYRDGSDGLAAALLFATYRLFVLLERWQATEPRDYGDRDQNLARVVVDLLLDRRPRGGSR